MDKINKNRSSFKKIKNNEQSIRKMSKNLNPKTPKYNDSIVQTKNHHFSKVKSAHVKEKKQYLRQTTPLQIFYSSNLITQHASRQPIGHQSSVDYHKFSSQKNISKFKLANKNKQSDKTIKVLKSKKSFDMKASMQMTTTDRNYFTTRKTSFKRKVLEDLYKKTQKVLDEYRSKQLKWMKQRNKLKEEIEILKRKDYSMKSMTSSASSHILRNKI